MGNTFPNAKFMTIFAVIIVAAWSIGLVVRQYLNRFTKELRNQMKRSFLATTVMSWVIVLILFSVT